MGTVTSIDDGASGQARSTAALIAPEENAERLLRSALDALSAHVAVLDEQGTIIAVNQAWRDFALAAGYRGDDHGVGTNYLSICERSADYDADASRTFRGLADVLSGRRRQFRLEYPCGTPDGPRWFELRASASRSARSRRVVVAHEDITHLKRAEESLSRLNARLMRLQDDERRKIARELHDVTAQNLLAITLNVARIKDRPEAAAGALDDIMGLAERSLQEVRTLCYLVHPPLLDDVGLEAALRWLARGFGERSGLAVEERVEDLGATLTQAAATALFRVAQEALLNVNRHADSAWARLTLRSRDGLVELLVDDAGRGLAAAATDAEGDAGGDAGRVGVGIAGMRVRLEQLGGRLELLPRGPGLRVLAALPLAGNRADRAEDE